MKVSDFLPIIISAVMLCSSIMLNQAMPEEVQAASQLEEESPSESAVSAVKLERPEEMRGVWVSYITLDMQQSGKTREEFEEKFDEIASTSAEKGFNTLIVQVRPFCDALYRSDIFPQSHILSGKQGGDCSYDALEIMCETAHAYGLQLHAWINPYRVSTSQTPSELAESSPYIRNPSLGVKTDTGIYLNPALDEVTELIADGAEEIIRNYDIDGIQFDDYFYPTQDESFDKEQYEEYLSENQGPSAMTLSQWRAENINKMLREVYKRVHLKEGAVFGISPQGNMQNNEKLYADVRLWYTQPGYADYICPQIYFSLDNPAMTFEAALADWCELTPAEGVELYIGLAGYKAGSDSDGGTWLDNSDILSTEIQIIREQKLDGFMLYSYDALISDAAQEEIMGVMAAIKAEE